MGAGGNGGTAGASGVGGTIPVGHPWPMSGHDPRGTRRSPVNTTGTKGKLKWLYQIGSPGISAPAIAEDGTVYVFAKQTLYALRQPETGTTGQLKWSYTTPESATDTMNATGLALGTDGTVYVTRAGIYAYAIAPPASGTTGELKWSFQGMSYDWLGPPVVGNDGTVYVLGRQLYVLDPQGNGAVGVLRWAGDQSSLYMWTQPAIGADGTAFYGSDSGELVAVGPPRAGTLGELRWSLHGVNAGWSPALADDGTIYVSGDDWNLHAISPPGGCAGAVLKWSYYLGGMHMSGPAIGADGTVYVAAWDLLACEPASGKLKWRWHYPGQDGLAAEPAVAAEGTVYVGSHDANVYAISAPTSGNSGVTKWAFPTGGDVTSSPAIGADGTIYVSADDGYLYAIQ